jgi:protein TonB
MSVFVNENGSVDQVKVLDATPRGVFEQVAEEAIRGWEFQPGVYQGESVAGWITQTFRFELKKAT